jgi:hypothetical protein
MNVAIAIATLAFLLVAGGLGWLLVRAIDDISRDVADDGRDK